ncbi:MAG: N-acetylglucosamine-6-phosphate deacetylase [bacterium]
MEDRSQRNLFFVNGRIITPFRTIEGGGLEVRGGEIGRVAPMAELDIPGGAEIIDVGGNFIAPGFIDIHVHGGGGADTMDASVPALERISEIHAKGGSTAILPTTSAGDVNGIFPILDAVREAKRREVRGAKILGVHLEGPYFSHEQRGAQDPRYIKDPDPAEYSKILDYSDDILRFSAAPELRGGLELGRELRRRGIVASIAHSNATYDEVLKALEAGYTHVTHLYSGTSGVRRINLYRVAGVIESAYLLDDLTVEIIADGKHLPPSLLLLVVKTKGADRVSLITDAMRAAGMPPGEYTIGASEDGQSVVVEDGVAKLPDRTAFAGSVATMNALVRNMVDLVGVPLQDAVRMASLSPAKVLRLDSRKGSLAEGKDADIVVFDEGVNIWMTIVEGRVVYRAE